MSEELKFEPTAESLLAILERLRAPGGCRGTANRRASP